MVPDEQAEWESLRLTRRQARHRTVQVTKVVWVMMREAVQREIGVSLEEVDVRQESGRIGVTR